MAEKATRQKELGFCLQKRKPDMPGVQWEKKGKWRSVEKLAGIRLYRL